MYCTYGDESYDETCCRTFAVAGIFGKQSEWDELSVKWFKATGGMDFHAADCDSGHGDFAHNPLEQNHRLYRKLTQLLCSTKLMGHAMVADLTAHEKYFPQAIGGDVYYLCFSHVLICCAELGYFSVPQGEVKFTFDRNLDKQYNATVLYDHMAQKPEWKFHPYLAGEVGFAARKGNAQIQAADLFARESMKLLDNEIGPVRRRMRGAALALRDTKRFRIARMDERSFAALSGYSDQLGKTLKGSKESEYQAWLNDKKCQDNTTMRIHYLNQIDALNRGFPSGA